MKPTIVVDVDVYNPGQFFACCGLFELTERLTARDKLAKSRFFQKEDGTYEFQVEAYDAKNHAICLKEILYELRECKIREAKGNDGPILFQDPFNLLIDWREVIPQKSLVKTWSGKQILREMLNRMKKLIPDLLDEDLFSYRVITNSVTSYDSTTAENAQDAGFSFNNLKKFLESSPAIITEFLAVLGLQRFCPEDISRSSRIYSIWLISLDLRTASTLFLDPVILGNSKQFQFEMYSRDTDNRYKSFSHAKLV